MSKFQLILLFIFGFFIFVAVLVFALYKGSSSSQAQITIWGSLPSSDLGVLLDGPKFKNEEIGDITYVEKKAETIEAEFTEALAQGKGPDLLILSHDKLWQSKSKLTPIPYQSVSERDFKEAFVEGGEVFLSQEGIFALPLLVDPMVLYYNRDLLSNAGISRPLSFWDEIYAEALALNKKDPAGNLTQSTIAMGITRNIPLAKDILSLLFIQAGTPVTGFIGTELRSFVSAGFGLPVVPAESALDFYTQFANPSKPYYSWNPTLTEAQTNFTSGDSAYYLGFASELTTLRSKSPTLNFSVAKVPQSRVSGKVSTLGRFYGVALSRSTPNPTVALEIALILVGKDSASALSGSMYLPPVRRDLLSQKPNDTIGPVFYESSLQARGWLDPDPVRTKTLFLDAVDSITSGRARTSEAVNTLSRKLDDLIKN